MPFSVTKLTVYGDDRGLGGGGEEFLLTGVSERPDIPHLQRLGDPMSSPCGMDSCAEGAAVACIVAADYGDLKPLRRATVIYDEGVEPLK